ncbi:TPA: hypothetical protein DEB00_01050 [Candidatus Uhrbacteria bacterium]|nr:hypothetical protein [Candidatus Uhrbacteria bacterium]
MTKKKQRKVPLLTEPEQRRETLLGVIRWYASQPRKPWQDPFVVEEVREFADGVMIVQTSDGRFTIFLNLERIRFVEGLFFHRSSRRVDLPENTGLIVAKPLHRSWNDVLAYAKDMLATPQGPVPWHPYGLSKPSVFTC